MIPQAPITLDFGDFRGRPALMAWLTPRRVRRWVGFALAAPGSIAVRVTGLAEARALNRAYRGRDYATDVLTFAYRETPPVQADLVLCAPVVARQARTLGIPLPAHYAHLLVHGTLHAQGWDHERSEADALAMEAAEILLLGALGFDSPY